VSERVPRRAALAVLGVLGAIAALETPLLGSDPWPFRPPSVHPHGVLGPLVRHAHERWDLGVVRTPAVLAGLLVAAAAVAGWRAGFWQRRWLLLLCVAVLVLVTVPAVLLQVGLRDATAPWFHTNDSTYQIELAGNLVRHGHDPYGHDYAGSGLERFYSRDGTVPPPDARRQVALSHFAYFPGAALTAAAWGVLPSPFDDYRVFVLLTTIGCFFAVLAFRAPLPWRLGVGTALAASPPLVRGAWFGTADAPSLLCLLLAFALLTRRRPAGAATALAAAILLKQFALVAVPFLALAFVQARFLRRDLVRSATAFAAVLAAGFVPFLVAGPGALWRDTIDYGASTYRILGYGLSALLYNAGVIDSRYGSYPFGILVLVVWLPVTLWLLALARRSESDWECAAGFAVSMFVLLFIARTFQTSYLVWPLTGIAVAALLAAAEAGGQRFSAARGASP
jgi:4-amino-4-deoxy-L-arabinose transferase-like glycosyltransferase